MKILHAIHDFLPRHQAGSEVYVLDISLAQQALGHQPVVLCSEDDEALPQGTVRRRTYDSLDVIELINNWWFPTFRDSYRSPLLGRPLRDVLRTEAPDILHIHNLVNLSFDLPDIARELGIPTVATLHDYTLVCPSGGQRVHRAEEHICTLIDTRRCSRCFAQHNFFERSRFGPAARRRLEPDRAAARASDVLRRRAPAMFNLIASSEHQRPPIPADQIEARLDDVQRVFESIDLFIAPSPSLGTEFRRLGMPAAKLRVSDYGFHKFTALAHKRVPNVLRIGFVGALVWHKGAHILLEAARALPAGRFEIDIIGDTSTAQDYVAALREQARGLPVRFLPRYERHQVPEIYASFDVMVITSLWPENSPLVIHEAFMAGTPVVGSRLGGTADLVTHDVDGLLYDAYSSSDLAAALNRLIAEPSLVARLAAAAPAVKSIEDDAADLATIYVGLLNETHADQRHHRHAQ